VKTEDGGDEMEAGRTESAFEAPTAPTRKSRRRGDPCADPGMVMALRVVAALPVPDTDPDLQITGSTRRESRRIAALKSSRTGAPPKISPPSTRRRQKSTVKHPVKCKEEEVGHNLGSPDISEDAETSSLSVGNGVQQAPLTSSRDVLALSKSTLKRKYEEEGQNLEDLSTEDSARTVAATKTGLECVRAKSLPFGCVDKPGTRSYTRVERARCRSMDRDHGRLGQLTERHGMTGEDTMNANDQLETIPGHRRPATKSARRKLDGGKYSSITNEAGGDESSASNGVLNSSSDSESTMHTDVEDENYEGGVEDEGPSSCAGNVLPHEGLS